MAKYFTRAFINHVLDRSDIIYLIQNKIKLRKIGENFFAICPFHLERNPSFVVNKTKQLYHCFGCGVHGNIIDFMMNYENLSFIESIETLADLFGIPLVYEKKNLYITKLISKNKILYQYMLNICNFYQNSLYSTSGQETYKYLLKRGFNKETIKYFSLGFSPKNWIDKILNKTKNITILHKHLGLIKYNKSHNNYYDIFYERVIFPIRNTKGFIIGFGGRTLKKNKIPKYLNSAENSIFHKKNELYGLYEIKKEKKNLIVEKILVVEGYTDVISLFQFNIKYAVAILGTTISSIHINKLFNLTNKIIYCYDGDDAGIEAHWKALKKSLSYLVNGKQVEFMFLPKGEDPDSLIKKKGKLIFEKYINNALSFSNFFFKKLMSKNKFFSSEEKTKFSHRALSLIKLIPDYIFQITLIKQLGEKIGIINFLDIYTLLQHPINNNSVNYINKSLKKTTIRIILSLLIQNPKLIKILPKFKFFKTSNINGFLFFMKFIKICHIKNITTAKILEKYRNTKLKEPLEMLATWNHIIPDNEIEKFFIKCIKKLEINILENRQEYLISLDRKKGLNIEKKKELWSLNKELINKKNDLKN
ncbi:DNA primase [Enterobacteriaceae endosymbiont of Donacia tomentosa]|uniref:DNA primase n=1 Tax=Enterobacteriaceae endosymbiont of Donacia tomentosa TaxID=2675787 RepID=UPI0014499E18|nr:DNA primase [Enterobacteriaceae endosymbiont of Donacia tomentosa]QJC31672.1 DNA primase [Enterobacteriaceae endosymbiont of Donacia tomentosa]